MERVRKSERDKVSRGLMNLEVKEKRDRGRERENSQLDALRLECRPHA